MNLKNLLDKFIYLSYNILVGNNASAKYKSILVLIKLGGGAIPL